MTKTMYLLKVKILYDDVIAPERAYRTDSGLDVFAHNVKQHFKPSVGSSEPDEHKSTFSSFPLTIRPKERVLIGTGIACTVGENYEIQVRPRSGLALKHGITVVNSPGTVDESYRGEIGIILINHSNKPYTIQKDEKIAQLVVCPVYLCDANIVDELKTTKRSDGGFGSTGE